MSVFCECCVLSGRGLCDGLITRPEESYRLWCVVMCDLETSQIWRPWPTRGMLRQKKRGCADKSLARPGRKQATANKLGIYSTYSPRSSIHFLARCSNFCKPLNKNSESCPSNQVSAAAMTSASEEKWRTFNCFFFSLRNRY